MAEVRPFKGLRYSKSKVSDLASVICPPYDVMSTVDQEHYYQKSPYNIVRMEHALTERGQTSDKYSKSAGTLTRWLEEGVLQAESEPAFYLHEQSFVYSGHKWRRSGIIARVRLEGKETGVVRPHEGTLAAPKNDRLQLLRACRANISPVFSLYEDESGRIASALASQKKLQPDVFAEVGPGEVHSLWVIKDRQVMGGIQSGFQHLSLYIADGHHRYETALTYRDERRRAAPQSTGEEAFNFVMMTLVSTADPGLLILPVHRLVRGLSAEIIGHLQAKLKVMFDVEEYGLGMQSGPTLNTILDVMRSKGNHGIAVGLYGLKPKTFMVLSRKTPVPMEIMPAHSSPVYRTLEVAVLKHLVMEGVLGIDEAQITYTPEAGEALGRVASGEYQLAFFLNPLGVDKLRAVADAGERLPGKSTYFYPKLPTGLVINSVE